MFLELNPTTKTAYIYSKENEIIDNKYIQLSTEKINTINIIKIEYPTHPIPKDNFINIHTLFDNLICTCGSQIKFTKLKKLPEDGWEELIDYWSCHNSEFKSMLDLKIKPCSGEALLSHFYFLANDFDLCCYSDESGVQKIFYNQVGFDDVKIIYSFFVNYFLHNNSFRFCVSGDVYEIKLFDFVIINGCYDGFKVGYKICKKRIEKVNGINECIANGLLSMLDRNRIDISVLGYELSYIY